MSPPDRRRRRVRPSTVVGVLLVAAVLAVLLGALARVGSVSGTYWQTVDRSYAAQGDVLIDRSNQSAAQLRRLLASWTGEPRRALEVQLDLLVRTTAGTARAAAALEPPSPWGDLGSEFAVALGDRARAVAELRTTVDGLLGMSPLPVATAGGVTPATATAPAPAAAAAATTNDGSGPVVLSVAQATTTMADAGALLEQADHRYGQLRRAFRRAPGRARLPESRWVVDAAAWSKGPVQTVVDQLAAAPQLAPLHQVVLVPSAISITPAPVPSGGNATASGTSLLPPTGSVGVTAVVADYGNVAEHGLVVTAELQPAVGRTGHHSATVSLAAGASEAVRLPRLRVRPGHTYQLTVAVTPPRGEVPGLSTSQSFTIAVAPNASPPPTTTTTQPPAKHHPTGTTSPSTTVAPSG